MPARRFARAIVLVIDSAGIGELPDAAAYGDEGSNTLGNIARQVGLAVPFLRSLGLDRLVPLDGRHAGRRTTTPRGAFGRMAEASPGKDSVTGHWEMAGVVLDRPFPDVSRRVFPPKSSPSSSAASGAGPSATSSRRAPRSSIGSGAEHVRTGKPIVYTSADSVFQVAAHEDVIPIAEQYRICEAAFDLVGKGLGVGRVIARPFVGAAGAFSRTANRHDYALEPSGVTLLDALPPPGRAWWRSGKVRDLFAGRGITRALPTVSDTDGLATLVAGARRHAGRTRLREPGGQRHAVRAPERCRAATPPTSNASTPAWPTRRSACGPTTCSSSPPITATTRRRRAPTTRASTCRCWRSAPAWRRGRDLGTRATFADLGQTLADNFGVGPLAHGTSFLRELVEETSVQHP